MKHSLHDLLEIENDSAFLEFRCPKTGYLLWPLVRNQFFRILISDLYYNHTPLIVPPPAWNRSRSLTALPRVLMHNAQRGTMRGDVLVMSTGAGHFLRKERWFNRITDYFALVSPAETVTIEGLAGGHIPEPRWNSRTWYGLHWQAFVAAAGRIALRERHIKLAQKMLDHARHRSLSVLRLTVSDEQMRLLLSLTALQVARLPVMHRVCQHLLQKVQPRIVLIEEGCYGHRCVFNHLAREMGVRVAELQHGMVSAGHDAYNYASLLRDSKEYQNNLPHDFLGYGEWWNRQINVPVQKWVIGHPHNSEQRQGLSRNQEGKNDILLLSDGIEFLQYLDLARKLSDCLAGKYRIVLRPHPLERQRVYAEYPEGKADAVIIDRNRDIYESFTTAYVVAGEVSTGLFEAVGLVEKVLLWETPKARFSYPNHPFEEFIDAKTFADKILDFSGGRPDVIQEEIWATNWRGNYQRYLEQVLHGVSS